MKWPWALGSNPCTVIYGSQGDRRGVKTAYELKLYICFLEPSNQTEPSSPGKKAEHYRAIKGILSDHLPEGHPSGG